MYNLDKIISKHHPAYRQLCAYYYFCGQIRGMTAATMQSKVYVLNNFLRITQLRDLRKISNHDIFRWVEEQKLRGNSGRSINVRLAHLKAMLHWQQEQGLKMPKLRLGLITKVREAPSRKVHFSRSEIERVLAGANPEAWLLIRLAFDCGLRISELQNLRRSDIEADRITIIGKWRKRRFAFLSPTVKRRLETWMNENAVRDYLWASPYNPSRPVATCTLRRKMQVAFQEAGFEDFCPHDLRHSYATDLKRLGVATRKIQAGLGHNSELTTERYLSDLEGLDLREIYKIKYSRGSCGKPQNLKNPKKVY